MISRRQILAGIAGATALGPGRAFAEKLCAPIDDQGAQVCKVGLDLDMETVRQRCDWWCWAACIEAVFAFHGRAVPQEAAVERLFGTYDCKPASDDAIIATINGSWTDQSGLAFDARAERLPFAPMGMRIVESETSLADATGLAIDMTSNLFANDDLKMLIGELDNGNPLIVGALGHATVLVEVSYLEGSTGIVALAEFVVRDPWKESENRRVLTPDEVRDVFFVARVTVEG